MYSLSNKIHEHSTGGSLYLISNVYNRVELDKLSFLINIFFYGLCT